VTPSGTFVIWKENHFFGRRQELATRLRTSLLEANLDDGERVDQLQVGAKTKGAKLFSLTPSA
jgi:hypothetical protein